MRETQPAWVEAGLRDQLTPRQREVIEYLREHGPTRQDALADALGSTLRGIGVVLSALTWKDGNYVRCVSQPAGGAEGYVWEAA